MNPPDLLRTVTVLIILLFVGNSCSTTRKQAVSCPELPGYQRNKNVAFKSAVHNKNNFLFAHRVAKINITEGTRTSLLNRDKDKRPVAAKRTDTRTGNIISTDLNKIYGLNKIDYKNNLFASLDNSNISAFNTTLFVNSVRNELAEIDHNDVSNMMNDDNGSLVNSFSKSEKTFIRYPDALIKSSIGPDKVTFRQESPQVKVEPFGVIGFITSLFLLMGLAGLIELGLGVILCGFLAMVFGAIGLGRIKKHPGEFKGRALALTSLIIGAVFCTLLTCLILAFLIWPPHFNI
jgi:hypothetical protein